MLRPFPYSLINMPPCLIWEDEDLSRLVGGELGRELAENGMFGRIIGKIDEMASELSSPTGRSGPRGIRLPPDSPGYHVGDFLTSAEMMRAPASNDPGYLASVDADDSSASGRQSRMQRTAAEFTHSLDAFRGRVITFVKNQPWFSSW